MKVAVVLFILFGALCASATSPEYIQIDPKTKKPVGKPVSLGDGLAVVGGTIAVAATPGPAPSPSPTPRPKTLLEEGYPYVPQQTDYAVELGVWQARDPSLWVGALIGEHTGKCVFAQSETCQQYVDLIGGAAVREAETYGMFLLSPRWQFVNFPDRASPFVRIFGGMAAVNTIAESRVWKPTGGVGFGVTTYLHHYVDLRAEVRAGAVDRGFGLALLSANVKTDRLLEFFATKLKDFGIGIGKTAIEATGTVLKATGEGVGGAVDSLTPSASPTPAPSK